MDTRLQGRAAGENPRDRSEAGWDIYAKMKADFEEIHRPHILVETSKSLEPAIDEIGRFIRGEQ